MFCCQVTPSLVEFTQVPPALKARDGLEGLKRKYQDATTPDITGAGETWEGVLSGEETEPDEPMEEGGENDESQLTVDGRRINIDQPVTGSAGRRRLTAASRLTDQVSVLATRSNDVNVYQITCSLVSTCLPGQLKRSSRLRQMTRFIATLPPL